VSSNQRAIRLAISGLLIVLGLISLSQAGFFVIRYLTLDTPLSIEAINGFLISFWRGYWVVLVAIIIHFSWSSVVKSLGWRLILLASCVLSVYSFVG